MAEQNECTQNTSNTSNTEDRQPNPKSRTKDIQIQNHSELQTNTSPPLPCQQNTNLDRTQLSLCVSLIENGVNPEALAVSPSPLSSSTYKVVQQIPSEIRDIRSRVVRVHEREHG